jgi:hypothetical protein
MIVGAVCFVGFGIRYTILLKAQRKREAVYHATFRSYQGSLSVGMTRGSVESYLKSKNVSFFPAGENSRWNDYIKIGEEAPPWFCSSLGVFVVLEFSGPQPSGRELVRASEDDTLARLRLSHSAGGCL